MSIWTEISGETQGSKHASLRKMLTQLFPTEDIIISPNSNMEAFSFSIQADSDHALKLIKRFCSHLTDNNIKFQLTTTVRIFG